MLRRIAVCVFLFGLAIFMPSGPCFSEATSQLEDCKLNIISLIESGKMAEAGAAVDIFLADFPDSELKGLVVHEISTAYKDNKQYYEAIELSEYVVNNWPEAPHAVWSQMNIAWSYVIMGDVAMAREQTEKLVANYGDSEYLPWALHIIAEIHRWQNNYGEARELYQMIIDKHGDSSWADRARIGLARVEVLSLIRSGRLASAQRALDKLVADFSADSELPKTLGEIAEAYKWAERYDEAERIYQQLARQAAETGSESRVKLDLGAEKSRVMALIEGGEDVEARESMEVLAADFGDNPDLPEALYWFAKRYEWSNKYDQAEGIYRRVIQQYPDSPYARLSKLDMAKGRILLFLGVAEHRETLRRADKLIRDFPDDRYLIDAASRLPEQTGAGPGDGTEVSAGAVVAWEQAIEGFGGSVFAAWSYHVAADIRQRSGDCEGALAIYERIVREWPDYEFACQAQFSMVRCYEVFRDSGSLAASEAAQKIEQAYETVTKDYPDCVISGRAFLELGWMSFKRGQWAKSAEFFESALEKHPAGERPLHILYPLGRAYEETGRLDKAAQVYGEFVNALSADDPRIETVRTRIENLPVEKQ